MWKATCRCSCYIHVVRFQTHYFSVTRSGGAEVAESGNTAVKYTRLPSLLFLLALFLLSLFILLSLCSSNTFPTTWASRASGCTSAAQVNDNEEEPGARIKTVFNIVDKRFFSVYYSLSHSRACRQKALCQTLKAQFLHHKTCGAARWTSAAKQSDGWMGDEMQNTLI